MRRGRGAEVAGALEAASAYEAVSLDPPAAAPGQTTRGRVGDSLGVQEERFDLVEYGVILAPALRALPARQRLILGMRLRGTSTQGGVATRLGMSQMHVSRLLRRARSGACGRWAGGALAPPSA